MKDQEYWIERIGNITANVYNDIESRSAILTGYYSDAYAEIISLIGALYAKHSKQGELTYQEMSKYHRMVTLESQVRDIINGLGQTEIEANEDFLIDAYEQTFESINEFYKGIGLKSNLIKINKKAIEKVIYYPWSGADFSSRIWNNKTALINGLRETLVRGFIQGQSIDVMSRNLENKLNSAMRDTKRVIRTESAHVINQASMDSYIQLGLKQVIWLTRQDERTCEECGPLDNEKMTMDSGLLKYKGNFISNPYHPNCRCAVAPYSKEINKYL
ncbi:hypothetical protein CN514_00925 [Bacillus sp. AFS001701]|uniref:minor capsid protein n=1 Tax=Bacillus sp. AFS001701 TaxID=2033480 RepID=UPI000BFA51FD|nr:minor capsid protein [Bacillus sp. AFS001701]PET77590.1 hypothetical protein CN514_00925 [Bacillus sp. AFS001701]